MAALGWPGSWQIVQLVPSAITLLLAIASYRLVLHPLRVYPGPFLAKLSDFYAGWHAIKMDQHLMTHENHRKYGPVYRHAPNRLVFNSLTALRDIYLNRKVTKSGFYVHSRMGMKNRPSLFSTTDIDDHRQRHRVIGPAVSEQGMRGFEPTLMPQVDTFVREILRVSREKREVDVEVHARRLTTDVIAHLAFGYALETQTEEANRFVPDSLEALSKRINIVMTWPKLSIIDPVVDWAFRKRVGRFRGLLHRMIAERMELPKDAKRDLWSHMATDAAIEQVKKGGIRGSELWSEAGPFFTAGGATTATAISSTLFYVSRNPKVYERLAAEIRTAFASGKDIHGGPALAGCKYLRAVIDETLRMSPPSPGVMWRELDTSRANGEPLVVDGRTIPPGTSVGVNIYTIMHNEAYFSKSFEFKPERWLGPDDDARATMRHAFIPFLIGDRACVGKALAYLEVSVAIAKIFWYFDFERPSGHLNKIGEGGQGGQGKGVGRDRPGKYQLKECFISSQVGPFLLFHARGTHWRDLD